ncbi:S1 RNA-binding domain-containing protein [Spiroplasma endosymbiont of Nebria brevicollis]|uniref:S1 RNA-binding domain-containing protein n=1 Tax=Spiroplasma endosymbiont of Nebria brevicollis TaxID=3066284 RepID=UPI00313CD261
MSTIIKNDAEVKIQELKVGDIITVIPSGFRPYGVFCTCPSGYSGLIHISRITPKFVKNVTDYFTLKTPVQAEITEIDHNKKQFSLSTMKLNLVEKKSTSAIDENGSGFAPVRDNVDNWFRKDDSN